MKLHYLKLALFALIFFVVPSFAGFKYQYNYFQNPETYETYGFTCHKVYDSGLSELVDMTNCYEGNPTIHYGDAYASPYYPPQAKWEFCYSDQRLNCDKGQDDPYCHIITEVDLSLCKAEVRSYVYRTEIPLVNFSKHCFAHYTSKYSEKVDVSFCRVGAAKYSYRSRQNICVAMYETGLEESTDISYCKQ